MSKVALRLVWTIVFFVALSGDEIVLTQNEFTCMEHFFRTLIGDSEGGYVFLDKKPICVHGFLVEDNFYGVSRFQGMNTLLREGALLWQRMGFESTNENIILVVYKNPDPILTSYQHILLINKKMFLEETKKNLSLFQYILGPEVTPERLLATITDPEGSFYAALKGNKVLIGIVLGFGTENSLLVSHIENMEESLLSKENFPFKRRFDTLPSSVYRHLLLIDRIKISEKSQNPTPSFGFKSIEEEISALQSKVTCSSLTLATEPAPFMYGRIKDEENDKKALDLEEAQKKIIASLQDEDFLKNVLSNFNLTAKIIPTSAEDPLSLQDDEISLLPRILAQELSQELEDESPAFQAHFIDGMKAADENKKNHPLDADSLKYERLKSFQKINNEIVQTSTHLKTIASQSGPAAYREVRSNLLYTQIKEEGAGAPLGNEKEILIHITIKDSKDNLLMDTWRSGVPESMDRAELIPGLNLGIAGMKKGEVREILIHPALAYGIYTTAPKGSYLLCQVGLVDFDSGSEEFVPLDFDYTSEMLFPDDLTEQISQLEEKVAFQQGFIFWNHYKKGNFVSLTRLLNELKNPESLPQEQATRILQKLHWIIYTSELKPLRIAP